MHSQHVVRASIRRSLKLEHFKAAHTYIQHMVIYECTQYVREAFAAAIVV